MKSDNKKIQLRFTDINKNPQKSQKNYAGFWVRVFSHIVEVFVLMGSLLIIAPTITIISYLFYWAFGFQIHHSIDDAAIMVLFGENMFVNILCFLMFFTYVIFFVSSDHQSTIGQRIMSIYVGNRKGDPVLLIWSIMRFLMIYLPIMALITIWTKADLDQENSFRYFIIAGGSLIFLAINLFMIVFTKHKVSLHDFLCGTRVFYGAK
ncbi:MAG: putative RDD family membrane protein YckC [Myxococcota bacterium]|jgi:uncharacterized RDD family membrane protein YckC